MTGPLTGVRVLDLSRLLPGAYCTLMLADLGADVVKVEEPRAGDTLRALPPLVAGGSALHAALNRGKRSVALDLKSPAGPEVLRRLAASADALVESFRPGVLDRLGAGFDVLSSANPRLVHVAITAYGQDGPYRDRPGHDIDAIAYAGVLGQTGERGGGPVIPAVQVADLGAAMNAAVGLLACVHEARRTGRGRFVDVAMLDAAFASLREPVSLALATGSAPERGTGMLGGGLACYRVYETGDGRHLAVGALEPRFWEALCGALGVPELADEQFAPEPRQAEIAARVAAIIRGRTRADWLERLEGLDACVAPVNSVVEALRDPQIRHRGLAQGLGGRSPLHIQGVSPRGGSAPALGEHTEEVLREAGFDPGETAALLGSGAVAVRPPR